MSLTPSQQAVRNRIVSIGRQRGASPKEIKAALETGLVESNLTNLKGGDADSAGWRQERASLYKNPTNLNASINRFYDETHRARGKYGTAGALAAAVQRPAAQYRGRYQQRSGEADQLLGRAGGASASSDTFTTDSRRLTAPAIDRRRERMQLALSFLQGTGRNPLSFATALKGMADTPAKYETKRTVGLTGLSADTASPNTGPGGAAVRGPHSQILELIHKGADGKAYALKNGQHVNGPQFYSSVWDGHANHVHVAAGPRTIIALGKLAQQMGLHVGENPYFTGAKAGGGVHAGHSYHYQVKNVGGREVGEAIDVSGDPRKMDAYAKRVQAMAGH